MFKKILFVAAGSMVALSAFAADMTNVSQSIELKDGKTVYIFKNGKMGMEDKFGRPVRGTPGKVMEAKDGRKLVMIGDEVMQVESLKPVN